MSKDISSRYKTFDEWSKLGFHIQKGSKSEKRNENGVCLFSRSQVIAWPDQFDGERREDDSDYAYAGFFDGL
jgi:hypothetical protein